jgi:AGZA family xanthine/uracil permease-like MFS transporter
VRERLFHLQERRTSAATELRGGAVTFATMSYIVFVQPAVLSQAAGMDFGAVMTATCLSAALATLVMGLWANYPIAEAPLMGENFFFAFSVAKSPAPGAYVQIGDLASPVALVALSGLAVTAVLFARGVRGGILIGLAFTTVLAIVAGLVRPSGLLALPPSLAPTFLQMDLAAAWRHFDLVLVFLIMLIFGTVGTLIGVSEQAGLMVDGRLPRADRAMLADAVGTLAGAALGTSTVSSYIESASGVAEGARTGLANVMTAALFLGALFFAPVVAMVGGGVRVGELYYYPITAPVVILVGSLMMGQASRIAWPDPTEAPAGGARYRGSCGRSRRCWWPPTPCSRGCVTSVEQGRFLGLSGALS